MKKMTSLLLALAMVMVLMVIPAYAAGNITVGMTEDLTACPGTTFEVEFEVTNNTGFGNGLVTVEYDPDVLEIAKNNKDKYMITMDLFQGASNVDIDKNTGLETGSVKVNHASVDVVTDDGVLFVITFKVKENINVESTDITLTATGWRNDAGEKLTVDTKNGAVTVGHAWDNGVVTTAPTCTADGVKTFTCTCGATKTEPIAATGHIEAAAVTENDVKATCTKDGSYDTVVFCSKCNAELSRETTVVKASGHTAGAEQTENVVEATCTKDGSYDTVVYCSVCNAELSHETTKIPATGHTAGAEKTENEVAATCTKDGSYDTVVRCTVCNEIMSSKSTTVPATGHSDSDDHYCDRCGVKVSDCVADGHYCAICGDQLTDHDDADGDGKCDTCGSSMDCADKNNDHKCDDCGETISRCCDKNRDHKCDVCGKTMSLCADIFADHKCDWCKKVLTKCADNNKNHKCDVCCKVLSECADEDNDHVCDYCGEIVSECADENKDHYCDICGKELTSCTDENDDGKCDWCGAELWTAKEIIRISGAERTETARKIADELKAVLGVEKFDAIVYASGNAFPDALTGTYLANFADAPILLYREAHAAANLEYIKNNLSADGVVYILGGAAAMPESVETELKAAGIKCVRLSGATRFETNLAILNATQFDGGETVLVCTGYEFADSLSASATGMPILLVNNGVGELLDSQIAYLSGLGEKCDFVLIGGEAAISADLAAELKAYDLDGNVERIGGATRFETSVLLAEKFFADADQMVVAYGYEYADGLCGGSLGYAIGAPVILATNEKTTAAAEYAAEQGIETGYVLGGTARLVDRTVRTVFHMTFRDQIIVK